MTTAISFSRQAKFTRAHTFRTGKSHTRTRIIRISKTSLHNETRKKGTASFFFSVFPDSWTSNQDPNDYTPQFNFYLSLLTLCMNALLIHHIAFRD